MFVACLFVTDLWFIIIIIIIIILLVITKNKLVIFMLSEFQLDL